MYPIHLFSIPPSSSPILPFPAFSDGWSYEQGKDTRKGGKKYAIGKIPKTQVLHTSVSQSADMQYLLEVIVVLQCQ